jgi:hypothetical protein
LELVEIFWEWIKNRWVIAAIIFIVIIVVATMILIIFSQPRHGAYTNAWYVLRELFPQAAY